MHKEECEGCHTNEIDGDCPWFDETLICPCRKCLIKMMCSEGCELMDAYTAKIKRMNRQYRHQLNKS